MALYDPVNTLAYHKSRVLTTPRNMADVPLSNVSARLNQYMSLGGAKASPETEALMFYGLNHGVSLIAQDRDLFEPLPADEQNFIEHYYENISRSAIRAFYYLLIICVREARHAHGLDKAKPQITAKFGLSVASFYTGNKGEDSIHTKLLASPPNTTIGKLTESLCWVFYNCPFSSGYGGKAWGKVADCLNHFVQGQYTAEIMVDTVWTLAHNNGPIFNKGHLYNNYGPTLYRILDVQRSGQIPQAILTDPKITTCVHPELRTRMLWLKTKYPRGITDFVDWFAVEALGSVHKYNAEKMIQTKSSGVPATFVVPTVLKASDVVSTGLNDASTYQINTNEFVKKLPKREAA